MNLDTYMYVAKCKTQTKLAFQLALYRHDQETKIYTPVPIVQSGRGASEKWPSPVCDVKKCADC
jgi:hypothetical protein